MVRADPRRTVQVLINLLSNASRYGPPGEEIVLRAGEKSDLPKHVFVMNMSEAVQEAYDSAKEGDIVLLSPAGASFVGFGDYRDRGNRFKGEVGKLVDRCS